MGATQLEMNMTDKELLTLAAKAAGIADGDVLYDMDNDKVWNPLDINTGDALRLAVKLRIGILMNHYFDGEYFVKCGSWRSDIAFMEKLNPDPGLATCRAIVRAAAEIGRGME